MDGGSGERPDGEEGVVMEDKVWPIIEGVRKYAAVCVRGSRGVDKEDGEERTETSLLRRCFPSTPSSVGTPIGVDMVGHTSILSSFSSLFSSFFW